MDDNPVLKEMAEAREFCSLIHAVRKNEGISLKYPLVYVFLSRYFLPSHQDQIARECNIVGYMDFKPIVFDPDDVNDEECVTLSKDGRTVKVCVSRSGWQQDMFDQRSAMREQAEERKRRDIKMTHELT